jgi:hypothetical protein
MTQTVPDSAPSLMQEEQILRTPFSSPHSAPLPQEQYPCQCLNILQSFGGRCKHLSMSRQQTASIFFVQACSKRAATSGIIFHVLLSQKQAYHWQILDLSALLPYTLLIICRVSGALLPAVAQNLHAALRSSMITVTTHKILIYKTYDSSKTANLRLMKLGQASLKA